MGIKDRKHINSEDSALFRHTVGEVEPVNSRSRNQHNPKLSARAAQRRRDEREVLKESLAEDTHVPTELVEDISFQRGSVTRKRMRELRGGKITVRDEIDLHGYTRKEARPLLHAFINDSAYAGLGCVRIVHGKGMRSGHDGPVLKNAVNQWLRNWDNVLAFCPARSSDGGTGAMYVLLNSARR
ncbi:MAG: Smr/MutS family protein [Gammaproteobacteria bacterium]